MLAEFFDPRRYRKRDNNLARHLLVLDHIMDQKQDDVVRIYKLAVAVVKANPVCIAVGGKCARDVSS